MYDEYVKRIHSLVQVRNTLFRFRYLLIALVSGVLVSATTLVSSKGVVQDVGILEASYVYGDPLYYASKAFLSTAEFEFRKADSEEWSAMEPNKVGSYVMRSKAENSFHSHYYGKEQAFVITPRPLSLSALEEEMRYGESCHPAFSVPLVAGDTILNSYLFTYENQEEETWKVSPKADSIHFQNAQGEDVTDCYRITYQEKDVRILPRELTISTPSDQKIYDATPLENKNYTLVGGELLEGDSLHLSQAVSQLEAGTRLNNEEFKVLREDGLDMSRHYRVNLQAGTLAVSRRPLAFVSPDKTFVYDGEEKNFTSAEIALAPTSLQPASGETIRYSLTSDSPMLKVGNYSNSFRVEILNGENDVTQNYDISYHFGTTAITKRPISIASGSSEHLYDEEAYRDPHYSLTAGSLAPKDAIESYESVEVKDAGVYANSFRFKIADQTTHDDFTSCYDINQTAGSLLIKKIDLAVEIIPSSVIYDGLAHRNDYRISSGALTAYDSFKVLANPSVINAGVYDNDLFDLDILGRDGLSNLKNYTLTIQGRSKALTIEKRPLTLHSLDQGCQYDGTNLSAHYTEKTVLYQLDSGSLAPNEYLIYKQKNDPVQAGKEAIVSHVSIYHQLGEKANDGDDLLVSDNYALTLNEGTFSIAKRSLTITTLDTTHPYNRSTALSGSQYYALSGDGLTAGDSLKNLAISCSGTNVGQYSYDIDEASLSIQNAAGEEVKASYEVRYVNTGKLTITPRDYSVTMTNASRVYDGTPFSSSAYEASGLLEGDVLSFKGLASVTHVNEGKVENKPSEVKVLMKDGTDVSDNYHLTSLSAGDIHVNPRPISLTSASLFKTFDGYAFGKSDVLIGGSKLAAGDSLNVSNLASESVKNVRDSGANTFDFTITNAAGEDVTGDYEISLSFGSLNILPCRLELKILELTKIYDGKAILFAGGQANVTANSTPVYLASGSLPDTYALSATLYANTELLLANFYRNPWTKSYTLSSTRDQVDMNNFLISWLNGDVTISQRPLTIASLGGRMPYSGSPFPDTVWIASGSLAAGDTITYASVEPLKEKGENQSNPIGNATITNAEGRDVTSSYTITYTYGQVTIY